MNAYERMAYLEDAIDSIAMTLTCGLEPTEDELEDLIGNIEDVLASLKQDTTKE